MPRRVPLWWPYVAAVVATIAAAAGGALIAQLIGDYIVLYVTFFAAVTFSAWYGGLLPALLATALSYLIANLYFVAPPKAFVFNTTSVVYFTVCLTISAAIEAWRRARRRAEASAEHVVSVVEGVTDGFIALDGRWRCTYMNKAAEELNRLGRHESIGRIAWGFFPLTDGHAKGKLEEAANRRVTVEFESYFEPQGRWFAVKASPVDAHSLALYFRDVTERKLAQIALVESEERLRMAQHGARAGLWDWDMVTGRVTWSDQYYVINGLDRSVRPSRNNFLKSVHPDDRAKVKAAVSTAIREHKTIDIQYRTVHPGLPIRWIAARGRTTVDSTGKPIRASGIVLDITERKRTEESLRFLSEAGTVLTALTDFDDAVQRLAELAVEEFADWCVVDMVDQAGQLEHVACACRQETKLPVLKQLIDLYPPEAQDASLSLRALSSGKTELVQDARHTLLGMRVEEEQHRRLLAELNPVSIIVAPMSIRDRPLGVLTFVRSEAGRHYGSPEVELATELAGRVAVAAENARLYGELQEAQRQKDDFLAMLAHELRNPLAAISYANEISKITDQRSEETIHTIDRQVTTLSRLLDDLLDVSRITRDKVQLKKELVDGAELIRRAVATVKPIIDEHHHTLELDISSHPMPLHADPMRVEQMLGNLLTNSAKYTPDGGTITVRAVPLADHAVFTIKDTGLGIAPAMLPRIFELFVQVDRQMDRSLGGLGIGLTVVRKLAEMHGGSVSAKSDGVGKGSEFTIRLPLADERPQRPAAARHHAVSAQGQKILIVDDNADLVEHISKLLELSGHTVATAFDGHTALEAARSFGPDVVLLDLGLPGLDGYHVAETLRHESGFADVRFIAVSGYGQPEDRRRTREAGFDHHLVKPVKFQALLSILSES